jgi:transposase
MFIRSINVRSSSGQVHEYLRIVESVREKGQVRQKVIANLGRRDTLEAMLPALTRFLRGDDGSEQSPIVSLPNEGPIQALSASTWGPMLVVRHFFQELGLWKILDAGRRWKRLSVDEDPNDDWVSRVLVLIANRLTRPSSEHALARWLESDYVCDREGRRYVPCWDRHERVEVDFTQLQLWYRTLDHLIVNKLDIEVALYQRLRTLFDFGADLVFYDITSTYFEGAGPAGLAKHGHSRDGKPRNVQVVVGMVMVAGWPIAHHVWAGNTRDSTTVKEVINDLRRRFQFRRVIFVGDRGMVTESNLDFLFNDEAHGFIVGMTRRRNPEAEKLIDAIDDAKWIECPGGINTREKEEPLITRVQEVPCDQPGKRVFVVDSEERRQYEQRQRKKSMERVRVALEKVQTRVSKGRLKRPEKIGAAAERALKASHGHRYYTWSLEAGRFKIEEHPVNLPREIKYEGKYVIQTDQDDLTPLDAVRSYKDLSDTERGFRSLKDPLSMRPIWHRVERRVRAHIFVAALAFLIERMLERALKDAGVALSAQQALAAFQTIRVVEFNVNDELRIGVTPGSAQARQVLSALGIEDTRPPTPRKGAQTRM